MIDGSYDDDDIFGRGQMGLSWFGVSVTVVLPWEIVLYGRSVLRKVLRGQKGRASPLNLNIQRQSRQYRRQGASYYTVWNCFSASKAQVEISSVHQALTRYSIWTAQPAGYQASRARSTVACLTQ